MLSPEVVARQAPLCMELSRQEHWSELPFPSPGDLPNPRIELGSPALAGGFFTTEPLGSPGEVAGTMNKHKVVSWLRED